MATEYLFSNNATTTLAQSVSSTATVLNVASGTGSMFPSPAQGQAFAVTLVDAATGLTNEICYCTSRSGDQLTVTRGREGTNATAWNAGDTCANYITADVMESWLQESDLAGYIPVTGGTASWLNVIASLQAGLGGPWRGDTATGGFRYTYGVTVGNPGNSANGAFSANICVTDVIGDANNDRSGIRFRGVNYNGDPFEYYFAWNGKVTTPSGALASQSALSAEITRASNAESNLQSSKVNRNGDDGISGSFNVGAAFTVGTSFSAVAATGYGFSYRRTTTLTGAYDWYSDYNGIKVNILNLKTDGTLNVTGSGWLQVRGVNVALSTDVANLQSQVNGKQPSGDYATNTALNNGLAGKLDISTYEADFSTSDDRVINLPYNSRILSYDAGNQVTGRINFPVAFSGPPTMVMATAGNNVNVQAYDWDATGFTLHINSASNTNGHLSVYAKGPK